MSTKSTLRVLTALTLVLTKSATAVGAQVVLDDELLLVDRCDEYRLSDREALQLELENLLRLRPEDPCIPYIVSLLGGPPLAQNIPDDDDDDFGRSRKDRHGSEGDDPNGPPDDPGEEVVVVSDGPPIY